MRNVRNQAMTDACKVLYMKYRGEDLGRLEEEMRAAGWKTFRRSYLHKRRDRGTERQGWIERFGWGTELARRVKRAAQERARRARNAKLRGTFEGWLRRSVPRMKWTARHHQFVCEHLRRITHGESSQLMLFMPPRHGKSELVTVRYAAWRLIQNPRLRIIVGCYSQNLANRFSRKIRAMVDGRVVISKERFAVEEWETRDGGGVKAVGVGSGITGFGADLVLIDDPVKGRAAANSRVFREKTWEWFNDDVQTRLEPGGAIVLIQTRWHEDDLAGRLLKAMKGEGDKWDVISLPALAEAPALMEGTADGGEAATDQLGRATDEVLWPAKFPRAEVMRMRQRLGPWSFAALYQQRPVPEGGTLFKREWFTERASKAPEGLRWNRAYDLAISLKTSADYTASFRVAEDEKTGKIFIADGFRGRLEYTEQRKFVLDRMEKEPDTRHGIEEALHGKALVQDLMRDPKVRGRSLRGIKVDGDKLLRAESWAGYAEAGKIVLVDGPWVDEFLEEVCRFTGRGDSHDDQVDAVSLAMQMLRRGEKRLVMR